MVSSALICSDLLSSPIPSSSKVGTEIRVIYRVFNYSQPLDKLYWNRYTQSMKLLGAINRSSQRTDIKCIL